MHRDDTGHATAMPITRPAGSSRRGAADSGETLPDKDQPSSSSQRKSEEHHQMLASGEFRERLAGRMGGSLCQCLRMLSFRSSLTRGESMIFT